jgi:hypothetical protein
VFWRILNRDEITKDNQGDVCNKHSKILPWGAMGVPVGTSGLPNHLFPVKILTLKDFTVILFKWLRNCWRFSSIILIEFNLKRLSMSILIEGSTTLNPEIIHIKIQPQITFILRMKQSLKMTGSKRSLP